MSTSDGSEGVRRPSCSRGRSSAISKAGWWFSTLRAYVSLADTSSRIVNPVVCCDAHPVCRGPARPASRMRGGSTWLSQCRPGFACFCNLTTRYKDVTAAHVKWRRFSPWPAGIWLVNLGNRARLDGVASLLAFSVNWCARQLLQGGRFCTLLYGIDRCRFRWRWGGRAYADHPNLYALGPYTIWAPRGSRNLSALGPHTLCLPKAIWIYTRRSRTLPSFLRPSESTPVDPVHYLAPLGSFWWGPVLPDCYTNITVLESGDWILYSLGIWRCYLSGCKGWVVVCRSLYPPPFLESGDWPKI